MAKKTVKKVDMKKVAKVEVNAQLVVMLNEIGIGVEDGTLYGFTQGTLVAHMENCDVQIKLITPKAGIDRYEKLEEDEEEEIEEIVEEVK